MQRHPDVEWDSVVERAIERKLALMEIVEKLVRGSKMSEKAAERLSHVVKEGMLRRHHRAG